MIQYIGLAHKDSKKPHGNSKSTGHFVRTNPSVIKHQKDLAKSENLKTVTCNISPTSTLPQPLLGTYLFIIDEASGATPYFSCN